MVGMKGKKVEQKKNPSASDYLVLLSPVITEKSSLVSAASNTYVFKVDKRADKKEIRNAVERVFKVQVKDVGTVNVLGKMKRTAKSKGRRANWKKAYVTLAEGQTIDLLEGI